MKQHIDAKILRRPGIEPGPPAWKAGILTTILTALGIGRPDCTRNEKFSKFNKVIQMPKTIQSVAGQKIQSPDPESNQGPCDLQSHALPTELSGVANRDVELAKNLG